MLPKGFVYLNDINASIIQDIKYATDDNFTGRPLDGYESPVCILTEEAALALNQIQHHLKQQDLSLKVFDTYRPARACEDLWVWSQNKTDQKMKAAYYPHVNKDDFFTLGYIVKKSSHTRGSTVDLTLVRMADNSSEELNMGTSFDFMDERSHVLNDQVSAEARYHRLLLQGLMREAGFLPYDKEWWHFTLQNEPFPNTYFDFIVK